MSDPAQPGQEPAGGQAPPPVPPTPAEEPFDRDRAMRTIETLRAEEKRAKQLDRELAAAHAQLKQHADAQLSETERLTKRVAELSQALAEREADARALRVRAEIERAARKLGAVDDEATYRLLDLTKVEIDPDGQPTNAERLVKALLDAKPFLRAVATAPGPQAVPATPRASGLSTDQMVAAAVERFTPSGIFGRRPN